MSKEIEFKTLPTVAVRAGAPAWNVFVRISKSGALPGLVYSVSDEEFESLKEDVILIPNAEKK